MYEVSENGTIAGILAADRQMQAALATEKGYDEVKHFTIQIAEDGRLNLGFQARDDFQRNLPPESTFRHGYVYVSGETIQECWTGLRALPSRKVRELTVALKMAETMRGNVEELKSELLRTKFVEWFSGLDEMKEQLLEDKRLEAVNTAINEDDELPF